MPDEAVLAVANSTGPLLADWAADPDAGGPLAGHAHVEVRAVAGAGKTTWSARAIVRAIQEEHRVLVCAFTNAQVIELTLKIADEVGKKKMPRIVHLSSEGNEIGNPPKGLVSTSDKQDPRVAEAECLVATCAKTAYSADDVGEFDIGFVDEAYQVRSDVASLVALSLAPRWAFVGDPGQIEVFSPVPVEWDQLSDPVASIVASSRTARSDLGVLSFDWSFRVPPPVAEPLSSFYGFPVRVASLPGERQLLLSPGSATTSLGRAADEVLDRAAATHWGFLELRGDAYGPADPPTAEAVAAIVVSLWQRKVRAVCEEHPKGVDVAPADIGIAVATNDQEAAVRAAITSGLRAAGCPDPMSQMPHVATYNRHQGLTYPVMVAWHPLSGTTRGNEFALDLGRWCVGITRHRHACIIVAREGIRDILMSPPLSAEAPRPGERNRFLEGWLAHSEVLRVIDEAGATVRVP